ncbi:MAG: MopE-related protein, partial [Myxococcota bacterium]
MHRLVLFLLPAIVGCGSSWSVRDEDGDGKSILEGDCYDAPTGGGDIGPEASEVWYDGIDQNCDGLSDFDKDGDGFEALAHGGTDCWDDPDVLPEDFEAINGFPALTAAQVNPDAVETFYDAVDANCDGLSDFDADGDGFDTSNLDHKNRDGAFGDDCYDSVELDEYPISGTLDSDFLPEEINPSAADAWYDGTDQDCDGWSDYDKDRDGYDITAECNDENPEIYYDPLIPEVWYNDEDENCDGNLYDKDLDGHLHVDFGGDDCWDDYDTTPAEFVVIPGFSQPDADNVFPLATDAPYDGVDGDCAGDSDFDADDDGYLSARWPDRLGAVGDDCDDAESSTHPGADDTWYDGTDADCAGNSDYDADLDGFDAEDEVTTGTDCDDTRAAVNPAPSTNENCGTTYDDNCDGALDLEDAEGCDTFYLDADDDGYGSTTTQCWCEPQVATDYDATRNDDCNDAVSTTNPGATEVCDAANVDENCNGTADNNDSTASSTGKTRYYHDDDRDGYGDDDHAGSLYCDDPSATAQAWVTDHTDCDDVDSGDYPGATEIVGNQDDESCDGTEICYDDDDNDGYLDTSGDTRASTDTDCTDNYEGTSSDLTTDCNDSSSTAYPGASETVADSVDQDCDGVDSCYTDSDGDNYGTTTIVDGSSLNCSTGTGAPVSTDCNDSSSTVYPGAAETTADGIDQDCDSVDSCYTDADNDNYGTTVVVDGSSLSCTTGTGAPVSTDCNDASSTVYPGASETVADGIDQDCDSVDSCYTDSDGDNYGTTTVSDGSSLSCATGTGAAVSTDCNDASSSIYPGATETVADGVDQDCDSVDSCYTDSDNDNYGTSVVVDGSSLSCSTG